MNGNTMKYDKKYYEYLDQLRESGVCNMFGASAYLVRKFKIKQEKATDILVNWMETFSKRKKRK